MSSVPEVFELNSSHVNEVTAASMNQDVDFIHDSEDSGRYSPEENTNDFQYEVLSTEQVFKKNRYIFRILKYFFFL